MARVSKHIGSNVWCTSAWTLPRLTQPTLNMLEPPAELSVVPCKMRDYSTLPNFNMY